MLHSYAIADTLPYAYLILLPLLLYITLDYAIFAMPLRCFFVCFSMLFDYFRRFIDAAFAA